MASLGIYLGLKGLGFSLGLTGLYKGFGRAFNRGLCEVSFGFRDRPLNVSSSFVGLGIGTCCFFVCGLWVGGGG